MIHHIIKSAPVFPADRLLALGHPAEAWASPALGSFEEAVRDLVLAVAHGRAEQFEKLNPSTAAAN
jgi:hypothetical protein